jgi:hypothetical protein
MVEWKFRCCVKYSLLRGKWPSKSQSISNRLTLKMRQGYRVRSEASESVLSSSSSKDCSSSSWPHKGHFPTVASTYAMRLIANCTGPAILCHQRCAVRCSRCGSSWSGHTKASSNGSSGTSNRSRTGVGSTVKGLRRSSELKQKLARNSAELSEWSCSCKTPGMPGKSFEYPLSFLYFVFLCEKKF